MPSLFDISPRQLCVQKQISRLRSFVLIPRRAAMITDGRHARTALDLVPLILACGLFVAFVTLIAWLTMHWN